MNNYDVIIIGGGASGIMTALNADKTLKIAILERSDRIGKKILVTGNGRCNITNKCLDVTKYNTSDVMKYFDRYNNRDFAQEMQDFGLYLYSDEEGRMYPLSNSANSVLDIMLTNLSARKNVEVITNCDIKKIAKDGKNFVVNIANGISYTCDKLVVATGGNSAKSYMADLGVKYSEFVPSLVALTTTKNKGLAGVRVSNVHIKYGNFEQNGEILFKEDGISGIVVFNLSTVFARNNLKTGTITIDFLPQMSAKEIEKNMCNTMKNCPNYTIVDLLQGYLHKALARNIAEKCGTKSGVSVDLIKKAVSVIKNYTVNVTGLSDNNQVHSGGVSLRLLDDNLMYRDISGLFFAGEIIDVDGECGGYNLQWAWTSGKIVGVAL